MGLDVARFERADIIQNFMPQLLCTICSDVFKKPKRLRACDHVFCEDCTTSWLARDETSRCPICRAAIFDEAPYNRYSQLLIDDRMTASLLDNFKMFCVYKEHGCQATVEPSRLETHEHDCEFNPSREVACPQDCGTYLTRSKLAQHSCITTLKNHIQDLINNNNNLFVENQSLKAENTSLASKVSPLNLKINQLSSSLAKCKNRLQAMSSTSNLSSSQPSTSSSIAELGDEHKLTFKLEDFHKKRTRRRGYALRFKMSSFVWEIYMMESSMPTITCLGPELTHDDASTSASVFDWSYTLLSPFKILIKSYDSLFREYSLIKARFSKDDPEKSFARTQKLDSTLRRGQLAAMTMTVVFPREPTLILMQSC